MLNIDESYFNGEERDGYYVEPMMKRAWAAEMEILEDIRIVCERHNIRFFADWGTLLGTIRHGGFIPWDDDIDISMFRADMYKFAEVARKELPSNYVVRDFYSTPDMNDLIVRVNNADSIDWHPEFLEKYHDFPFTAGVDIFPLDYVCRDKDEMEMVRTLTIVIENTMRLIFNPAGTDEQVEEALTALENMTGKTFNRSGDLIRQLLLLTDQLHAMYTAEDADEVAIITYASRVPGRTQQPVSAFADVEWRDFEGLIKVPVPVGWDAILKSEFGNYMEKKIYPPHDNFPFYKSQRRDLKAHMDAHPECKPYVERFL